MPGPGKDRLRRGDDRVLPPAANGAGAGGSERQTLRPPGGGGDPGVDPAADGAKRQVRGRGRPDLPVPGPQRPLGPGLSGGAAAKPGGGSLRRAEGQTAAGENAPLRGKPAAAGRAHQPPGHPLGGVAGGLSEKLRRGLHRHLPRPVLPGQGHRQDAGDGGEDRHLLQGQLQPVPGPEGRKAPGHGAGLRKHPAGDQAHRGDHRAAAPVEPGAQLRDHRQQAEAD